MKYVIGGNSDRRLIASMHKVTEQPQYSTVFAEII
jgi:hypothetical protein